MSVSRGAVWWAAIPGLGNRPVLIVSAQALNRALTEVTVARHAPPQAAQFGFQARRYSRTVTG